MKVAYADPPYPGCAHLYRDHPDYAGEEYAALRGWTQHDPLLLTAGLRDAYEHGLAVALPVDKNTLGWAMETTA